MRVPSPKAIALTGTDRTCDTVSSSGAVSALGTTLAETASRLAGGAAGESPIDGEGKAATGAGVGACSTGGAFAGAQPKAHRHRLGIRTGFMVRPRARNPNAP